MGARRSVPFPAERIAADIDRTGATPVWRQLYRAIRDPIVGGQLTAGTRLPSSRALADDLGLSRHSVVTAVDQLIAEGYLVGRRGSGTFVGSQYVRRPRSSGAARFGRARLSARGDRLARGPRSPLNFDVRNDIGGGGPFRVGLPAVDAFPVDLWRRALGRAWTACATGLGYGDPVGLLALRDAVADYVAASRGMSCTADQVVITAGSQAALDLCARVLLDPDDHVAVEDPGYLGAYAALRANGAELVPIPVDAHGLIVGLLDATGIPISLAYVTPTHQFPSGVTMTAARRLALLEWADRRDAWILEDDYDSEYRYGGRPLDPLAVLDSAGRVIYIGTFSKVMFPSLRLGYLVIPSDLVDTFAAASMSASVHPPTLEQSALAGFIRDGHFARHLQRTKALHAERRDALLDELGGRLAGALDVHPDLAGLHVAGLLTTHVADVDVVERARQLDIDVWPISSHCLRTSHNGVILGYGSTKPEEIAAGVRLLAQAIDSQHRLGSL